MAQCFSFWLQLSSNRRNGSVRVSTVVFVVPSSFRNGVFRCVSVGYVVVLYRVTLLISYWKPQSSFSAVELRVNELRPFAHQNPLPSPPVNGNASPAVAALPAM